MNASNFMLWTPTAIDLLQVASGEKPEIDFVYLTVAIIASLVGSGVRVAYENQKKRIIKSRVIFIFICSLCVSYLVYEFATVYEYIKVIGILSIVGGIISVDIIKFFIEDLPTMARDFAKHWVSSKTKGNDME